MRLVLPFHSYSDRSKQLASRRLINCYPEQIPLPGKAPIALRRSPGIEEWITLPTSPIRGMLKHQEVLYVVAGSKLYSVADTGTYTELGTITGHVLVPMATNGQDLVIVNNPDGFIYSNGTFVKITDADFTIRGASDVDCLDSFMIYIEPDSGRCFSSQFLSAGDVDPLDFATAEGAPDNLVAVIVDHRQIFLFGVDTTELWFNSGSAGFPFLREQNGLIECGCSAKNSPVKADNTVGWLSDKRIAVVLNDLTAQRVSTTPLEQRWQEYESVADAYSFAYIHEGHTFWSLNFPSAGESFEFDFATKEWHDRSSRLQNGNMGAWRVATHAWCYGSNIVGDGRSGRLGIIKAGVHQEWGETQRMEWIYPSVYANGKRAFHKRLDIIFERGVGLNDGQGSDPQALLYVSDDGGKTFDAVQTRSLGKIGEYRHRASWTRLGTSDDRVYKGAVTDPVPVTIIDTQLEVEGGKL